MLDEDNWIIVSPQKFLEFLKNPRKFLKKSWVFSTWSYQQQVSIQTETAVGHFLFAKRD